MKRRNLLTPDAIAAPETERSSRRDFLRTTGALIVGFSMGGRNGKAGSAEPD